MQRRQFLAASLATSAIALAGEIKAQAQENLRVSFTSFASIT